MPSVIVEVFKTNVRQPTEAVQLIQVLLQRYPSSRINFDLEDCDRVLRMEGQNILPEIVIDILRSEGYQCCELD